MIKAKLKSLFAVLGDDDTISEDFWIPIEADIGPSNEESANIFTFYAVSIKNIEKRLATTNLFAQRGLLVLKEWDIDEIREMVNKMLTNCTGETWEEVSCKVSRYAIGEYEDM